MTDRVLTPIFSTDGTEVFDGRGGTLPLTRDNFVRVVEHLEAARSRVYNLRAERDLLRAECAASRKLDATDLSQRGTGLLGERLLVARAAVDAFVMSRAAPPSTAATPSTKEAP